MLDMKYLSVEDLIISGPRRLQISVLEKKEMLTDSVQVFSQLPPAFDVN